MRLKLGAGLKDRDVAPHVFETRQEAHAAADGVLASASTPGVRPSRSRKKALPAE